MSDADARALFLRENSEFASRDRTRYRGNYDLMPEGLKEWWRARALLHINAVKEMRDEQSACVSEFARDKFSISQKK